MVGFVEPESLGFEPGGESAGQGSAAKGDTTMRAASSTRGPDWLWQSGVVGAEFRGRIHEGSFRVLGPEFKRFSWAAAVDVDFRFRVIRRSGSRNC